MTTSPPLAGQKQTVGRDENAVQNPTITITEEKDIKSYKNAKALLIRSKKEITVKCSKCNNTFTNIFDMVKHVKRHNRNLPLIDGARIFNNGVESLVKKEYFMSKSAGNIKPQKEMKKKTTNLTWTKCLKCDELFLCKLQMTKHLLYHNRKLNLKCKSCDASYNLVSSLNRHTKLGHISSNYDRYSLLATNSDGRYICTGWQEGSATLYTV